MPDHTAASAAEYLAAHGYTVGRRRIGGRGAPKADTIRRWCERGKIEARRVGYIWLIAQEELDQLLAENLKIRGFERGTNEEKPQQDA